MELKEYMGSKEEDDGDNEASTQPKEGVDAFYFAKINSSFIDPALEERFELAKQSLKMAKKERLELFNEIQSLKKRLETDEKQMNDWIYTIQTYEERWAKRDVERFEEYLEKYWPESAKEDPENVPDPKIEEIRYKERTEELTVLLHKTKKIAEEKRIMTELDQLKRYKEQLDHDVKEAEAKIPKPVRKWDDWRYGSKYDIFRLIRAKLVIIRKFEQRIKYAKDSFERNIADIKKKICILEKKHSLKWQEQEKAVSQVLELQPQVRKQADLYREYCKLMKRAAELAEKKDVVALRKLSCEEVEGVMSRWTRDEEFRTNYNRSIQLSLSNRELSSDGRINTRLTEIDTSTVN